MEAVRGWVWIFSGIAHFHLIISSQNANTAVYYLRAELCYGQMTTVQECDCSLLSVENFGFISLQECVPIIKSKIPTYQAVCL